MTKNLTTGGLIRERRIAQALSLGQLASRLGVPPASVRAWERGDEVLPQKLAPSVADALGLEASDLLKTLPAPTAEPTTEAKPSKAKADPAEPAKDNDPVEPTKTKAVAAAAVIPSTAAAAATPPATTPKKPKSPKAKTGGAAKVTEDPEVGEPIETGAPTEPALAPAAEAEMVEEAATPSKAEDKQTGTTEPAPADADKEPVDDQLDATTVPTAEADSVDTPGDADTEASKSPAEAETPLTDLPTEVVEVIPVAFTDEVTQAVPKIPAKPTVDDLASTAAVEALLSGSATATSSTQVVGAPVTVVAEKLPYWKDPNQRWRYWARAIATVAIMGVFLIVLGWAFGELSDALGGFLDQFSDASEVDPLNR